MHTSTSHMCAVALLMLVALHAAAAQAAVKRLDTAAVAGLWRSGYAYLDVRTREEVAAGRVPKSVNVPWVTKGTAGQQPNPNFVQQVQAAFPDPNTRLIVACQSEKRSEAAAKALGPKYPNMVESKDGWLGWVKAGLPTAV